MFLVPKHGWASSGNTPEPHTAAKLLHKRNYRLASKSPAIESLRLDSPGRDTPNVDPPRTSTPCPRSFTPSPQTKMPKKKELAVKVAQIVAEAGHKSRPSNFSRETYVIMNKALQGSQRTAQTRNDIWDNTQRVRKYVTHLSSDGRASVTTTGKMTSSKIIDFLQSVSFLWTKKFCFLTDHVQTSSKQT